MDRFVCVHGHFYQPPRENPWLQVVELQDGASPYHDWNERITAECYATNALSRILDDTGRIVQIVNNYAHMSFNFGPTLLAWLEENASEVYEAILEADRESQKSFSGHGSAIAQIYNHIIMPLANSRDKRTEVVWGIQDFEHRFRRRPEGMWLSETAVDLETLDVLAEQGIRFTILAPHQARSVREVGDREWRDVSGGKVDPRIPYLCHLPSGRTIVLFFYDGPISRDVAFGKLLKSGEMFAGRLLRAFSSDGDSPQLVHIATDGETYGHHHRFGDMALAYALHHLESEHLPRPTNYGEYLERYPPTHEVDVFELSSWSCPHGVERWRSDCGCSTGAHPEWHQAWRTPLRDALDWLRDTLAPAYEEKARSFLKDPWEARDDSIRIVLDRSEGSVERFLRRHGRRELDEGEKTSLLKLLELQRHTLLMYTSCGWYFDDMSGIETVQIIQYAGRALQLAGEVIGSETETQFLERLTQAKSNVPEHGNGRLIYERHVRPAMLDLEKVGAHYAISSLFEDYGEQTSIFCYTVEEEDYTRSEAGVASLILGRAKVTSQVTRESTRLCFGVLHMGDHNVNCGVRKYRGHRTYQLLANEIADAFAQGDFPKTVRLMDRHFGTSAYSLKSLFRDEQRKITHLILESTVNEAEAAYRQLYEYHAPMVRFLKDVGVPAPKALSMAADVVLNNSLRRAFERDNIDAERIENLLEEATVEGISFDTEDLEYALRLSIEHMTRRLFDTPGDMSQLRSLEAAVNLLPSLPFQVNLWKVQNIYYEALRTVYPEFLKKADGGDADAEEWVRHFTGLGESLRVHIG